jgi:hypothetical protein
MVHISLWYGNDENMLRNNLNTIKKDTEALFDTSKEAGLDVNTEETKYMLSPEFEAKS